nr:unnamed protein product [Callosobruchus chinensis]
MATNSKSCENQLSTKVCKRCKCTAQSGLKCIKCDTVIHMGCVKYLKNVTVLDNEQIICCNDKTSEKTDPDGDSEFFDALAQQAVDFKVDIRIFNYIIKQKDQLIRELYDKIEILKINNKLLEDNASKLPSTKHNIENSKNGQSKNSSKNTKNIPAVTYAENEIPTIDLQGVSNKHVASAILKEQTN